LIIILQKQDSNWHQARWAKKSISVKFFWRQENMEENNIINFPKIKYFFWMNQNEFFSDIAGLSRTIEIGLMHVKKAKPDLVTLELQKTSIKSNLDLVKLIEKKIVEENDIESSSIDKLLLIFDLIQAWGGQTGRGPYVQPARRPVRSDSSNPLPHIYKNAIKAVFKQDFQTSLNLLNSINRVSESFATKHIFFWSKFGPHKKALPIYDTRIKLLLFQKVRSTPPYENYVTSLNQKASELKIEPEDVERALFSFSQFYFLNNKLELKKNTYGSDSPDLKEAIRLESMFLNKIN
jgi:hypothetical protein